MRYIQYYHSFHFIEAQSGLSKITQLGSSTGRIETQVVQLQDQCSQPPCFNINRIKSLLSSLPIKYLCIFPVSSLPSPLFLSYYLAQCRSQCSPCQKYVLIEWMSKLMNEQSVVISLKHGIFNAMVGGGWGGCFSFCPGSLISEHATSQQRNQARTC